MDGGRERDRRETAKEREHAGASETERARV